MHRRVFCRFAYIVANPERTTNHCSKKSKASCFPAEVRATAERTAKVGVLRSRIRSGAWLQPNVGPRLGAPKVGDDGSRLQYSVANKDETEGSAPPEVSCSVAGVV